MKKLLLSCGVAALLMGSAGFAQALPTNEETREPWLHAVTTLTKTISTTENINLPVTVTLNQTVTATPDDFAEASATGNQVNQNNHDCGDCAEKLDVIDGSADTNTGLISINQAAGNDNNQGTLVSAAVDFGPSHHSSGGTTTGGNGSPAAGSGFANAQAEATQINGFDPNAPVETIGNNGNDVEAVDLSQRQATIYKSGNLDRGLVYINQATGNNDNQLNELALAFSERPSGTAIAEAVLGQFNMDNRVGEGASLYSTSSQSGASLIGINKAALIDTSLNNDIGVFGVNQSVGNNGNQANLVSVAAVGSSLPGF